MDIADDCFLEGRRCNFLSYQGKKRRRCQGIGEAY